MFLSRSTAASVPQLVKSEAENFSEVALAGSLNTRLQCSRSRRDFSRTSAAAWRCRTAYLISRGPVSVSESRCSTTLTR